MSYLRDALVAQLDRASDYGSEGCEFESRRARQLKKTPFTGVFFNCCNRCGEELTRSEFDDE